ncbi:presenilin-associated rhomboid-like protein A, mitochondrial [Hydra vulgaris]|nr:presenilins-associated rhomboid-like protein, mitochondrial [Hydra vulgaris]
MLARGQGTKKVIDFLKSIRKYNITTLPIQRKGKFLYPIIFTTSVGVVSFVGCAILQYERSRYQLLEKSKLTDKFSRGHGNNKALIFRNKLNEWWNRLSYGQKVTVCIISLNTCVFLCWKITPAHRFMKNWFLCSPTNKRCSPLLLSVFSHSEAWHFFTNMFVLWSFSPLIQSVLGTEQFLAFYLTGGTFASLISHFLKVSRGISVPSLGASGALLAVLALCCIEKPESRLSIVFLPFFTFSAGTALYGIIALDLTGLVLGWKVFDHAAHLGGTLFGAWYILNGHKWTWDKRELVQQWWHKERKRFIN